MLCFGITRLFLFLIPNLKFLTYFCNKAYATQEDSVANCNFYYICAMCILLPEIGTLIINYKQLFENNYVVYFYNYQN